MISPALASDEDERLDALRALYMLDTAREERFDRLTRMAKRLFNVPIVAISLIDEHRQWFKSSVGLDVCETPRDISFCGHAILSNQVFVIPDASLDERFADNPLVIGEPFIRFYAGFSLLAKGGYALGTLCIIDTKPRTFSDDDIDALSDLAALAQDELISAQLASTDELTGLLNRRGFLLLGRHCLDLFRREKITASMAFIDLDGFKAINDQFGHTEGDKVLVEFASLLSESFRRSDIVARQSGDEFVVLLANVSKPEAIEVFERFQTKVSHAFSQPRLGYDLQFSFGIVEFNQDRHQNLHDLISEGDLHMYAEKRKKYGRS